LLDRPRFIDRNFVVRVEDCQTHDSFVIFSSPDEGMPIGSERFLWSKDSAQLLLVGKHFVVHEGAELETGESLYLLYDVASGVVWCNARQQSSFASFGLAELAGHDFGEEFGLRSSPKGDR
jgi:hypothetical protein